LTFLSRSHSQEEVTSVTREKEGKEVGGRNASNVDEGEENKRNPKRTCRSRFQGGAFWRLKERTKVQKSLT